MKGAFASILVGGALAALSGCGGGKSSEDIGSRSRPIPVGRAANIGLGWRLKVLRVEPNAERQSKAAEKADPPPQGTHYLLARLALTYHGIGTGNASDLVGLGLRVISGDGASYDLTNASCGKYVPKPNLGRAEAVSPTQTARGYICFQTPSDATTLVLHTGDFTGALTVGMKGLHDLWFALPAAAG
jgi:hypothetical protein